jgi:hypothetical protein
MPMRNWINIGKSGDIRNMHIKGSYSEEDAIKHLEMIKNQKIDAFGLPDNTWAILKLKYDIEVLYGKMLINNDRTLQVFIDIKEKEISDLKSGKSANDSDYFASVAAMIKAGITNKTTENITIYEYENNYKILEQWQKKELNQKK